MFYVPALPQLTAVEDGLVIGTGKIAVSGQDNLYTLVTFDTPSTFSTVKYSIPGCTAGLN